MASGLHFERSIQAPVEQVYRMFTNGFAFREWLCDQGIAEPRPGGRLYLGWTREGYYADGNYTELEQNKMVEFTWRGRGDPGETQVRVVMSPQEDGRTDLVLFHEGFGDGEAWERTCSEAERGWETGLENLQAVLEKGPDLRIVNRPMMGILFGNFTPEAAARHGVYVTQGALIDGTIEGLGAQKAGLQRGDVMVEMNGHPVDGFDSVVAAMQGKRAGDIVSVAFYRGAEQQTVEMELARRPMREMPADAAAFSAAMAEVHRNDWSVLDPILAGATDAQASRKPAPGEWSAKEILTHLIHSERLTQANILTFIFSSGELNLPDNSHEYVAASVDVIRTLEELVAEVKRAQAETVALLAHLPEQFIARKSSLWLLGFYMLGFTGHGHEHAEQLKAALAG